MNTLNIPLFYRSLKGDPWLILNFLLLCDLPSVARTTNVQFMVPKTFEPLFVCVEVLRPSQPNGSCRAHSVFLTTPLQSSLSPLSG